MLTAAHLGAVWLTMLLPWPIWLQGLLAGGIVASAVHALRRHAWRRARAAAIGLEIDTDGDYSVRRVAGDWLACRYVESFVSPWLVIVRVIPAGRRRPVSVLVAVDAVAAEEFRELRARLHFQTPTTASQGS
ncbi:MAG: hypothetical protein A2150_01370 [Candidatus Muproteobacteria bacterium RBG_16_64_11]|uniref:Toxin CptA n=1 Tax=Candidatus Muproteobacteria bacterium RBG_16_64_11 TaxID=1817758 RepID=A0A1F6T9H4_9PROT|nr:MAG: hypothetical protein A2150_01370 [Candidatus Muproteobacteria bacterium RBG_16_64_11]